MTPQELKNSILQLAIQGKLVEQRPEEGTAEVLYHQIQKEKQALIKAGKIKKEKPLPEISEDEKPFDIPESWAWTRIRACTFNYGQKKPDSDFCYIDVGSIDNTNHRLNEENFIVKPENASSRARKIVTYGNVIFATIRPYLKNICIIDRDFPYEPIASTAFAVMDCCEGLYNKYLFYALLSPMFMEFANRTDKAKGVAYPAIGEADFFNGIIPLPPLAEQCRIVAKIEELLPYIDRYEQAWGKLEAFNKHFPVDMQKSILQMAVQGKLVPQDPSDEPASVLLKKIQKEKQALIKAGKIKKEKPLPEIAEEEIPFEIPESWVWVRLSDICNISDGTHQTPHYIDKGMPFISAQNVKPYHFMPEIHRDVSYDDYLAYNKYVAPQKGDILMTRVGAGIGEAALIDVDMDFSIYVSLTLIKCYSNAFNMKYLLHVLNSPIGRQLAEKKTLGKSASQGNLNLIFIREFVLPIPPLAEQRRIVAKLEEILPLCERLKE